MNSLERASRALIVVVFGVHVAICVLGVDFGEAHWDEPTTLSNAHFMWKNGSLLPRHYIHPTGSVELVALALAPEGLDGTLQQQFLSEETRRPLLLRARTVFSALSATTVLAAALAAFAMRRRWDEAVLAALCVAGSFEVTSHARFLVPDAPALAFISWSLCACIWAKHHPRLLYVAALLAGLAIGTKFTAVALLVPLCIVGFATGPTPTRAGVTLLCGCLGFVVATPGILFEPHAVFGAVAYQREVYGGGFYGYGEPILWGRVQAMALFVFGALLSPLPVFAFAAATLAIVGAAASVRSTTLATRLHMLSLIGFTLALCALLLAQGSHIARNYLPLTLPLAVGASSAFSLLHGRLRIGIGLLIWAGGISSLAHNYDSALSINDVGRLERDLITYVATHPSQCIRTSAALGSAIRKVADVQNLVVGPDDPACPWLLGLPETLLPMTRWSGADPFLAERVFGSREINWNLYPTWAGPSRVILLAREKALAIGAHLDFNAPLEAAGQPSFPQELMKKEAAHE
jgi:hypothetical protein